MFTMNKRDKFVYGLALDLAAWGIVSLGMGLVALGIIVML